MEKNVLIDLLEGLWEPVKMLEHIRKEYGVKWLKISINDSGYLDIDVDEHNINRCAGTWRHTSPLELPFK